MADFSLQNGTENDHWPKHFGQCCSFWKSLKDSKTFQLIFTKFHKNISKKFIKISKIKWDISSLRPKRNKNAIFLKEKQAKSNQRKVPIQSIISKWKFKKYNFIHQRAERHFPEMSAWLQLGQMQALKTSKSAKILAHEVRNAYQLPWKVPTVPDEKQCVCWCWHDKLDRRDNLHVLEFCLQAWEACFRRRSSSGLRSIRAHTSWECSTEVESPIEVDVARVRGFETCFKASSAEKAWLSSMRSSSCLGWSIHGVSEVCFSESILLTLGQTWRRSRFLFLGRWFRRWGHYSLV